jgi:hypothetical protein
VQGGVKAALLGSGDAQTVAFHNLEFEESRLDGEVEDIIDTVFVDLGSLIQNLAK